MSSVLKELLTTTFPLHITPSHIRAIEELKYHWEHKNNHWGALNTPMLGVTKIVFTDSDQRALFDIFHINREEFKEVYHKSKAVFYVKYKDELDEVGKEQLKKVGSDPFNGFVTYLCHCISISDIPEHLKVSGIGNVISMLQYKFFTSVISNAFPHPATEEIMMYTIEHLSALFTIRQPETSTWFLLMKEKAFDVYKPRPVDLNKQRISHFNTIRKYDDDDLIVYIITDIQTKIRKFIINIVRMYHKNHQENKRIITSSTINTIDGTKIIQSISTSLQNIIGNVVTDAININRFIDNNLIFATASLNEKLRTDVVHKTMIAFSTIAAEQFKSGKADLVLHKGDVTLYVGYRALISAIIQKSFRFCTINGVNMTSKRDILIKIKDAFTSSKINNQDVRDIKDSITKFLEDNKVISNFSLIPSLRITFVLYVIMLSFKYM